MLIKLVKKKRKHVAQIHALERSENLGVCLVSKCIMLQDSDIGLQYTPTNIVTNYDMKTIESTKDLILKFLQTFRNTILCHLQRLSLMNVVSSSRWHLNLQNCIDYGK